MKIVNNHQKISFGLRIENETLKQITTLQKERPFTPWLDDVVRRVTSHEASHDIIVRFTDLANTLPDFIRPPVGIEVAHASDKNRRWVPVKMPHPLNSHTAVLRSNQALNVIGEDNFVEHARKALNIQA